jgi:opacity protein-like surface antigen
MLTKLPDAKQAGVMKRTDGMDDATYQALINGNNPDSGPGRVELAHFNAGWNGRVSQAPITVSTWHLLTFVHDSAGADSALYVDGQRVTSTTVGSGTGLSTSFTSSLKINAGYGGARLDGVIDELRIYSRALRAAEILTYYQQTR